VQAAARLGTPLYVSELEVPRRKEIAESAATTAAAGLKSCTTSTTLRQDDYGHVPVPEFPCCRAVVARGFSPAVLSQHTQKLYGSRAQGRVTVFFSLSASTTRAESRPRRSRKAGVSQIVGFTSGLAVTR
jgi:carbohydrate-selective porin OprB